MPNLLENGAAKPIAARARAVPPSSIPCLRGDRCIHLRSAARTELLIDRSRKPPQAGGVWQAADRCEIFRGRFARPRRALDTCATTERA